MMEYVPTIGSSLSLCNIDADNEMNEELEEIATTEQICMSTQTNDEPRVGLEFNCIEDAKKFYNDYAFKMGFSIRKTYHYKSKKHDDAITSVIYCCSKAGHSKSQTHEEHHCQNFEGSNTPKKQFANRRSGCKAHIVLRIDDRGKWVVTVVANEHNHELIVSPSKTRFFRSHRNITNEQKELIHMMNEQNISTSQIMAFMQAREGGRHNIQFTRIGIYLHRNARLKILLIRNAKEREDHKGLSLPLKRRLSCQELAKNVVKKDTILGLVRRLLMKC